MRLVIKALLSLCIILVCGYIASQKKLPALAGLIAVAPLTGLLVLIWTYLDNGGDSATIVQYCTGAVWGIIPSILFFIAALICFRRGCSLAVALAVGFAVWLAGAFVHQVLLK